MDLDALSVLNFLLAKKPNALRKNYFPDSIGTHKAEFCSARTDPVASYGEAVSLFIFILFYFFVQWVINHSNEDETLVSRQGP